MTMPAMAPRDSDGAPDSVSALPVAPGTVGKNDTALQAAGEVAAPLQIAPLPEPNK
jgi:hypothetical protein